MNENIQNTQEATTLQPVLRKERHLKHPIQKVWAALSQGEHISHWWAPAQFDATPGGSYELQFEPRENWDGKMRGQVLEANPPHRLVYTFEAYPASSPMRVTWTLEETAGGTKLVLEHDGFDRLLANPDETWGQINHGWNFFVPRLELYLDTMDESSRG